MKLTQKLGFFKQDTFEIKGADELEVTFKSLFKSQSAKIPFNLINTNPVKYKKLNTKALFLFIICIISIVFAVIGYIQDPIKNKDV